MVHVAVCLDLYGRSIYIQAHVRNLVIACDMFA